MRMIKMNTEEFEEQMMEESNEDDLYTKRHLRDALEEDDLNAQDAAFMEGYLAGS